MVSQSVGQWTFNQADVVFCFTETDRKRLKELGVSSRIEVVQNGIDTERFTPEGHESALIDAEGPVLLFVGRLVEGKRPGDAVEAFATMLSNHPSAELYLCGDGPLRESLEEQVRKLGIGVSVTFLGHMAYDEMPKVYRSGDVLVLPSRAEGMPRTVLEAFASGVPVIANNLQQISSVVRNGGETVDFSDDEALAKVLDSVLDNHEELRGVTRRFAVQNFRWQDTVERTTEVLESLVEMKYYCKGYLGAQSR